MPEQNPPSQPDIGSAHFAADAHRQSAAVAASEHEGHDQAFIDALSDTPMTSASPPPELLAFVRAALRPPPARVLEVGAGHGELAAALAEAGYDVVAIDPGGHVPEVHAVPLHEVDEPPASFAAAVAVLSLHHVEPLSESCRRLGELVRPGGTLVIDEFDMDRFDEVAARWWLEQRGEDGDPAAMVAAHDDLHPVRAIRTELSPWFELGEPVPGPYLYRWDLPAGLRGAEEEQIARGALPATGARLIGTRRAAA